MTYYQLPLCLVAIAMSVWMAGCGSTEQSSPEPAPISQAAKMPDPGEDAQAAAQSLIAGLNKGHPEAFWEFLPADFQDDLNGLIHDFAQRMDREIWLKAVGVFRKLAEVLKSQKQFLAGGSDLGQSRAIGRPKGTGTDAAPTADWARLSDMLETVINSDLASLDRLQTADGGALLTTAGGKVIEQLRALSRLSPSDDFGFNLEQLSELKVAVVSSTKETANLKFEAPGEPGLIVKFALHRGKWIPEALENEWQHHMGNTRAWIAATLNPEALSQQKPKLLAALSAAESALDKMAAAKTPQDFAKAGQQASVLLITLFATLNNAPDSEPNAAATPAAPVSSREIVTVVVEGKLDDDAQDALREQIKAVTDDPARAIAEITGDDETSIYKVGPVSDVEAFSKRLKFLSITRINTTGRVINTQPVK
ncbi:MAG: hypothetical protein JSS02_25415 [Planctomycetes bacterium]|nr:hypothetical protein [Planctomycetota bacterium]